MPFKLNGKLVQLAPDAPGGSSLRGPSRLSAALKCEYKWHMRYQRGIVRIVQDTAPLVGTIFHLHQAFYWAQTMDSPPEWFFGLRLEDEIEKAAYGHPREVETARRIDEAFKRWNAGHPWKALDVEKEVAITIGELDPDGPRKDLNSEVVTSRLDMRALASKMTLISDYKSKVGSRLPPFEAEKLAHDFQACMNMHITRKTIDPDLRAFFHVRASQEGKPYHQFDRQQLRISPRAYDAAPRLARLAVIREDEILSKVAAGEKPAKTGRLTGECTAFNRMCEYAPICNASTAAEARSIRKKEYKKR